MKHDNSKIKQALEKSLSINYQIKAVSTDFIPVGEESYAYKVTASSGKVFFVKYCWKPNIIKTINQVNSFLVGVANKKYVVPPIVSNCNFSFETLEGRMYVYPYIEGDILTIPNEEFGKPLVNEITNIIADVHNININRITTPLPIERFDTKTFIDSYESLVKLTRVQGQNEVFKKLWEKYHERLNNYISNYASQGNNYQKEPPNMVVTHGDITGRNIILAEGGMKLVDWDGVMIAPRERDLIFYLDNPNFAVKNYLHLTQQESYCQDVARYYGQRWAIESILDNFEKLYSAKTKEESVEEYIDEIENYMDSSSFK